MNRYISTRQKALDLSCSGNFHGTEGKKKKKEGKNAPAEVDSTPVEKPK